MVKLKMKKANKPHHGLMGPPTQRKPLNAGAHVPQRTESGFDDAKGYEDSKTRRQGKQTGKVPPADSRVRKGPEGLSKGSPPPGVGKSIPASIAAHKGTAGRGGAGVIGGSDGHKGRPRSLPESLSSAQFEKLGAG
jgi:hypothetical protein